MVRFALPGNISAADGSIVGSLIPKGLAAAVMAAAAASEPDLPHGGEVENLLHHSLQHRDDRSARLSLRENASAPSPLRMVVSSLSERQTTRRKTAGSQSFTRNQDEQFR